MKRALVTGGNRGIGFAVGHRLIAEGLAVTIARRDSAATEAAAAEIGAGAAKLDVASDTQCCKVVEGAGGFDALVNNAGILPDTPLVDDPPDFEASIGVTLRGPYYLMQAVLPRMNQRGYGWIANVSSNWGSFAGRLGGPGTYWIAKAALNALTCLPPRESPATIKVNAMCLGWVHTRMSGKTAPQPPSRARIPRSGWRPCPTTARQVGFPRPAADCPVAQR